jgi:hypothetical protein
MIRLCGAYGARREVDKPKRDVGRSLHPELLGLSPKSIDATAALWKST